MVAPRIIPHSDGAGVIEKVGPDVDPSRVGERVWIWNGQWKRPFGTAATYIALPSEQTVRLPDGTSFESGACLGIPALTAYRAVTTDRSPQGETVLVSGGAGAVGHYAIQFARLLGAAQIIATVSSAGGAVSFGRRQAYESRRGTNPRGSGRDLWRFRFPAGLGVGVTSAGMRRRRCGRAEFFRYRAALPV